jgi:uncharacterized protein (TIGR03086 family)
MTTTSDDSLLARWRRISGEFARVASAVPDDGWSRPTPCAGWAALDVVKHQVEWMPSVLSGSAVIAYTGPNPATDPVGAWKSWHATVDAALCDPEVAAKTFDAGPPGTLSVAAAVEMLLLGDVIVHTWDLARAMGVHAELDEGTAASMLDQMAGIDEILRASGHFGPKVEVGPDASTVDRLIAFTGRDPHWTAA